MGLLSLIGLTPLTVVSHSLSVISATESAANRKRMFN